MKRVLLILFFLASITAQGQYFSDYNSKGTVRLGAGYTHDFPGLNGYTAGAEYSLAMSAHLEGAVGGKWMNLAGQPRTSTVTEFTRAKTLDLALYFLPLQEGNTQLRLGLGYSFVFYSVRRSFPLYPAGTTDKTATWKVQDASGRSSGINLMAEYAFQIPSSPFLIGLRAAWYKSYDRVTYLGPFLGINL